MGLEGTCCGVPGDPSVSFHPADVSGIDWMVRHGRSLALSVAVNVAPSRLCTGKYSSEVQDMILSNATADRVRLCGSQTGPLPPARFLCQSLADTARSGEVPRLGSQRHGFKFYVCW